MPRIPFGRTPRLAALLVAAVLGLALASAASAQTPSGRGPNGGPTPTPSPTPTAAGDCAVLLVQLNGDRPPTRTCPAQVPDAPQAGGPTQAATPSTSCGTGVLQLFEHPDYGGRTLCVSGTGILNLEDYFWTDYWPFPWPKTWTDRLSSFRTGQYYVNFYEHKDFGGQKLRYASYQSRASMPSGWNDRVSSVCIWNTGNTCP